MMFVVDMLCISETEQLQLLRCAGQLTDSCHSIRLARERDVALSHVQEGCCNLERHISNMRAYGVPVVVAINKFATDSDEELAAVKEASLAAGRIPLLKSTPPMRC